MLCFLHTIATIAVAAGVATSSSTCNVGGRGTMVVFGNSLSDIGSRWRIVENKRADFLPPPWFEGRFSSGFMWNEWAAAELNMTLANFAFGGATSDNTFALGPVPSIQEQLKMFLEQRKYSRFETPNDDIVVIEIGTNDMFAGFDADAFQNHTAVDSYAQQITQNIGRVLTQMVHFGFKRYFVTNIPPLSLIPYFVNQNASSSVRAVIDQVNTVYKNSVEFLRQNNPHADIQLIDISAVVTTIVSHSLPSLGILYGSEGSCFVKGLSGNFVSSCTNPDKYFFMDDVHPTRLPHKLLGYLFVKLVQDPEFVVTPNSIRDTVLEYEIVNASQPVVVAEYFADGSYGNINSQIGEQAARPTGVQKIIPNGSYIPYTKNNCDR